MSNDLLAINVHLWGCIHSINNQQEWSPLNVGSWPTPAGHIVEIHTWRIAAYWTEPDSHPLRLPIAAPGHEQSFEQTNKRSECASFVKIIASIEDPQIIRKILAYLDAKSFPVDLLPQCRAPPGLAFSTEV
jgi:hypothetical protein